MPLTEEGISSNAGGDADEFARADENNELETPSTPPTPVQPSIRRNLLRDSAERLISAPRAVPLRLLRVAVRSPSLLPVCARSWHTRSLIDSDRRDLPAVV